MVGLGDATQALVHDLGHGRERSDDPVGVRDDAIADRVVRRS